MSDLKPFRLRRDEGESVEFYEQTYLHVVYALGEDELRRMTGNNPANPTLALPIREVFARGQRVVSVQGPALLEEARAVHDGFWE
jgi:hypothetical protein